MEALSRHEAAVPAAEGRRAALETGGQAPLPARPRLGPRERRRSRAEPRRAAQTRAAGPGALPTAAASAGALGRGAGKVGGAGRGQKASFFFPKPAAMGSAIISNPRQKLWYAQLLIWQGGKKNSQLNLSLMQRAYNCN